ncbi:MAG TPA: hypothetical protein VNY05_24140 [Candidatus Acidoferrales bacterium]|jgi:hypothetical protein|nr:hypothetical protein [Candidatus Acidoferrales bacterium]
MFPKSAIGLALLIPLIAGNPVPPVAGLTVHEWGTFTSIADESGSPMYWNSLTAPSDLPCFVNRLPVPQCVKCGGNTVRMETPVLYFYSPKPATVSVQVDFPKGLITEWYPKAVSVLASDVLPVGLTYGTGGRIDWGRVEIGATGAGEFPNDGSPSHYYAARETDSAALRVNGQEEKLLFYRGVAVEGVFLEPRWVRGDRLELHRAGLNNIPFAVLFENRDGQTGYRVIRDLNSPVTLDMPELTADVTAVHKELGAALTAAGLYPKEAAAMIETWRDSWFEEGMRVFYLVPRANVDAMLPLKINPAPATTERVFVGRVELLSPHLRQTIRMALAANDIPALAKCGRFLEPFLNQLNPLFVSPAARSFVRQALAKAAQAGAAPCKTEPFTVPTGGGAGAEDQPLQ